MEITENTLIEDVLNGYPALTKVFIEFGLPCLVCGEPFWGTVEELAREHKVDVTELLKKLNKAKKEMDEKI
ncbi:hypothetical protein BXT86_00825 [candidate division WOR-3 bacterium 4484_100]|uniref:DUF1858 domain-containing protein n=1 Tax=candidate division WOR-3 bacterium 4484_100 TaxID=1936077 RepID=A0A1V4QGK3_UNCW3|nr:MAG: hypothetical protein BXT86_00825 [candidate division WOR-3 bacterium 4484_100]